jgi:hypothetical protein
LFTFNKPTIKRHYAFKKTNFILINNCRELFKQTTMEEEKKVAATVSVDNNLQSHQQSLKDRIMASIMNSPDDEDVGDKGLQ